MNEKRWKTKGGVVVIERGRSTDPDRRGREAVKIHAYRETGGYHGLLWLKNLTPIAEAAKPTPRAIRYALEALRNDFEPRDIPYSELLALRRFLEAQLPEEP